MCLVLLPLQLLELLFSIYFVQLLVELLQQFSLWLPLDAHVVSIWLGDDENLVRVV